MNGILDYFYVAVYGIVLLFLIGFGMHFWYMAFPVLIVINIIKIFGNTHEKYVYDLRFWINLLDILDAVIVIAYIVSLSLYFLSNKAAAEICNYINIASLVVFILNSISKKRYLADKSK